MSLLFEILKLRRRIIHLVYKIDETKRKMSSKEY